MNNEDIIMKNTTKVYLAFITILIFSSITIAQVVEDEAKAATKSLFTSCKKMTLKSLRNYLHM